jgi:hypothetical protein
MPLGVDYTCNLFGRFGCAFHRLKQRNEFSTLKSTSKTHCMTMHTYDAHPKRKCFQSFSVPLAVIWGSKKLDFRYDSVIGIIATLIATMSTMSTMLTAA